MRVARSVWLGLAAAAAATVVVAAATAAASPVRIVEAQAQFPFRSYVLTLPKAQALSVARLHVSENGTPVRGLSVVSAQAAKQGQFGVILAIDASESMKGKPIVAAMAAARTFAAQRNPGQQLGVVVFDGSVRILQPLTTNAGEIRSALSRTPRLSYGTRIYDALDESAALLDTANVQGASIVLLSDGTDVGSHAKAAAVLKRLAAQHVRVFTVGLQSRTFDARALEDLSAGTQGSYSEAAGPAALRPIFNALGYQLSREYLVTYQSLAGPGVHMRVRAQVDGLPGAAVSEYVTPSLDLKPAPPYRPSTAARIIQSWVTMLVIALLAAGACGWGIASIVRPREGTLIDRVGAFVSIRRRSGESEELASRRRVDLLRGAEGTLERLRWWPRFKATLELADINASPTQIVSLTLVATALTVMILYLILGVAGFLLGLGTPFVARAVIQAKLARKRRAFADQLPDNLEVIAAALRAGHSLIGSLSAVVDSSSEPSRSEFRRVVAEEQLGVPLEEALGAVVIRMDNRDLDQVALVARLQRETGGSAAEVIDRVIETVRSRQELRRLVRTLTTQGRLSRWILTGIPIVLMMVLPLINHGYLDPLLHRTSGQVLLAFTALMVAAGSVVIGKIVNIKI